MDKNGFFELKGVRYASAVGWTTFFQENKDIQTSPTTILKSLRDTKKKGITARDKLGRIWNNSFCMAP